MSRWRITAVAALAIGLAIVVAGAALTIDDDGRVPMRGMMAGSPLHDPRGSGTWVGHGMPPATVDSEVEYLTEMVAHHEEAVAAAEQLTRSSRSEMQSFGAAIVATQSAQIEQMQEWRARWYAARSTDVDYLPMMRDLSGLSGDRLDHAFLEDMIGHHMVAVMMSQQLLMRGLARHDEVNELAQAIRGEQRSEIFWMRHRLADWFDAGWDRPPATTW